MEFKRINILEFGAAADNGMVCTEQIQAALDEANRRRDCTVVVPAGVFVTGTLNLGSVTLELQKGAVMKGSPDLSDYRGCGYRHNEMGEVLSLLYSMNGSGITICGEGTIDMSGRAFFDFGSPSVPPGMAMSEAQKKECTVPTAGRPNQPVFFRRCSGVTVQGVRIIDAPCWTFSFCECSNVRMLDLTIDNDLNIGNNDGMHFCGCRDVIVRGCVISSGDDCIALTGITDWDVPCQDVVISDCILRSCSKAIAIGYMHSIVRNVTISNVIIRESNRAICIMSSERTGLVENVTISNVQLDTRIRAGNWWGNGEPIFIMATWHHYDRYALPAPDRSWPVNVRNVCVQSADCSGENAIGIVGSNHNIREITLEGIRFELKESADLGLKGRVIDLSPSEQTETIPGSLPSCWLHMQSAQDVEVRAAVRPYQGSVPFMSLKDCRGCRVSIRV
jgi:polygalacturonase